MIQEDLVARALLELLDERGWQRTGRPTKPSVAAANRRDPIQAVARELSLAIAEGMAPRTPSERLALQAEMKQAVLGIFRA